MDELSKNNFDVTDFFLNISNLRNVRRELSLPSQARISYSELLGKTESPTQRALAVSLKRLSSKKLPWKGKFHIAQRDL